MAAFMQKCISPESRFPSQTAPARPVGGAAGPREAASQPSRAPASGNAFFFGDTVVVSSANDHRAVQSGRKGRRRAHRLAVLAHPSLLVVDEIGYLPSNHSGAVLLIQLMNRRYEHASTVIQLTA